jgi:hypothetical protein
MSVKKKRRQCISCDKPLRKGVARRALVLVRGEPIMGLCCIQCVIGMVPIVVPPPTTIAPLCVCCKRGRATTCGACISALEQNVRELTKANVILQQELAKRGDA